MTFQIGDKVVYPNQGVGTIENISTRTFGTAFEKFYLLRFGCSMTVLVPLIQCGEYRLAKGNQGSRDFADSFLPGDRLVFNQPRLESPLQSRTATRCRAGIC